MKKLRKFIYFVVFELQKSRTDLKNVEILVAICRAYNKLSSWPSKVERTNFYMYKMKE